MPTYVFECRECETVFEERRPMAQATAPATCPTCAGSDTKKRLGLVAFMTAAGSDSIPVPVSAGGNGGCCGGACGCSH